MDDIANFSLVREENSLPERTKEVVEIPEFSPDTLHIEDDEQRETVYMRIFTRPKMIHWFVYSAIVFFIYWKLLGFLYGLEFFICSLLAFYISFILIFNYIIPLGFITVVILTVLIFLLFIHIAEEFVNAIKEKEIIKQLFY